MKKLITIFILTLSIFSISLPAWATTYYYTYSEYATGSGANGTYGQNDYLEAGSGAYITTVYVSTEGLQSGDSVGMNFWDSSGNLLASVAVTSGTITAPPGSYNAKLIITNGSVDGVTRWAWVTAFDNTAGNTAVFAAPDMGSSGGSGGSSGGSGGSSTIDLTSVTNDLQTIINNQTSMISQLDDVKSSLNTVNSQLTTANSTLDTISNNLNDLKSYIETPRQSSTLDTSSLNQVPTFDPTPPDVSDPAQPPYVYNKTSPQMPPFQDSPGPLPVNPDPQVMAHDPAAKIDAPTSMNNPSKVDPVNMDHPIVKDPVNINTPVNRDPVNVDTPRTVDTINMDSPVSSDNPISRDTPISKEQSVTPDAALTPDPSLTPSPSTN